MSAEFVKHLLDHSNSTNIFTHIIHFKQIGYWQILSFRTAQGVYINMRESGFCDFFEKFITGTFGRKSQNADSKTAVNAAG